MGSCRGTGYAYRTAIWRTVELVGVEIEICGRLNLGACCEPRTRRRSKALWQGKRLGLRYQLTAVRHRIVSSKLP